MHDEVNKDHVSPNSHEDGKSENVKKDFKGLLGSVKHFLSDLLDIRNNTDQEATRESIIADIPHLLDSHLFYFYCIRRLKCKFYGCGYWCDVNFAINGAYFRYGAFFGYK